MNHWIARSDDHPLGTAQGDGSAPTGAARPMPFWRANLVVWAFISVLGMATRTLFFGNFRDALVVTLALDAIGFVLTAAKWRRVATSAAPCPARPQLSGGGVGRIAAAARVSISRRQAIVPGPAKIGCPAHSRNGTKAEVAAGKRTGVSAARRLRRRSMLGGPPDGLGRPVAGITRCGRRA
ncbi:hypothetical protein [Xanthobacter sp. KR7-225]|uniref:hypothetical protein n=1 Tax=Xanthobacter sp. KR7-225 TaxID=3156613 RepID=UPI0032B4CDAB